KRQLASEHPRERSGRSAVGDGRRFHHRGNRQWAIATVGQDLPSCRAATNFVCGRNCPGRADRGEQKARKKQGRKERPPGHPPAPTGRPVCAAWFVQSGRRDPPVSSSERDRSVSPTELTSCPSSRPCPSSALPCPSRAARPP